MLPEADATKVPVVEKGEVLDASVRVELALFVHWLPVKVASNVPLMVMLLVLAIEMVLFKITFPPKVITPAPLPLMFWLLVEKTTVPVPVEEAALEFWVIPF